MSEKNNVTKFKWGMEICWATTPVYEGRMLVFEAQGNKTPLHFHTNVHRSWFVNSGKFKLRYIDTSNAGVLEADLKEGNTYTVEPHHPVQLIALQDGCSISEIRSVHEDDKVHFIGN
jgi:hypothetical protein